MLAEFVMWLQSLWADFDAREPTEQITLAITVLGAAFAVLAGIWKAVAWMRRPAQANSAEAQLIADAIRKGEASDAEIASFARRIYASVEQRPEQISRAQLAAGTESASAPHGAGKAGDGLDLLTGGDDDRNGFVRVVQELAASEDSTDRRVILEYAKGNVSAALSTLEARARAASGAKAAAIWSEVAALARPISQARSIAALEEVLQHDAGDVLAMARLARAYSSVDRLPDAIRTAEKAVAYAVDPKLKTRALLALARAQRKSGQLSLSADTAAIAEVTARQAATDDPTDQEAARWLANTFELTSVIRFDLGEVPASREAIDRAIRLYDSLIAANAEDQDLIHDAIYARFSLATLENRSGDTAAAQDVLATAEAQAETAQRAHAGNLWLANDWGEAMIRRAFLLDTAGDEAGSDRLAREAEGVLADVVARDPDYADARVNLLWAQLLQTRALAASNRTEDALRRGADHVAAARAAAEASGSQQAESMLSVALWDQANVANRVGNALVAEEAIEEAVAIAEAHSAADPSNLTHRRDVLVTMSKRSDILLKSQGEARYAEEVARTLAYAEESMLRNPGSWDARQGVVYAIGALRHAEALLGNHDAALELAVRARKMGEGTAAENPGNEDAQMLMYELIRVEAASLHAVNRTEEAVAAAERAHDGLSAMVTGRNSLTWGLSALGHARVVLSDLYFDTGRAEDGLALLEAECADLQAAFDASSQPMDLEQQLVMARQKYARKLGQLSRYEDVIAQAELAEATLRAPGNEARENDITLWQVTADLKSSALSALGRNDEARALATRNLEVSREAAERLKTQDLQGNLVSAILTQASWALLAKQPKVARTHIDEARRVAEGMPEGTARRQRLKGVRSAELSWARAENQRDLVRDILQEQLTDAQTAAAEDPGNMPKRLFALSLRVDLAQQDFTYPGDPGQFDDALAAIAKAAGDFPDEARVQHEAANLAYKLALSLNAGEWTDRSLAALDQSLAYMEASAALNSSANHDHEFGAINDLATVAHLLSGEVDAAEDRLELSAAAFARYEAAQYDAEANQGRRHQILFRRSICAMFREDLDLFQKHVEERAAVLRALVQDHPGNRSHAINLSDGLEKLCFLYGYQDRWDQVDPLLDEIDTLLKVYADQTDTDVTKQRLEAVRDKMRANLAFERGDLDAARAALGRCQPFLENEPADRHDADHFCDLALLALLRAQSDPDAADFDAALAWLDPVLKTSPRSWTAHALHLRILVARACASDDPEHLSLARQARSAFEASGRPYGLARWVDELRADARFKID